MDISSLPVPSDSRRSSRKVSSGGSAVASTRHCSLPSVSWILSSASRPSQEPAHMRPSRRLQGPPMGLGPGSQNPYSFCFCRRSRPIGRRLRTGIDSQERNFIPDPEADVSPIGVRRPITTYRPIQYDSCCPRKRAAVNGDALCDQKRLRPAPRDGHQPQTLRRVPEA